MEKEYEYRFIARDTLLEHIEREVVRHYKVQRLSLIDELELAERRRNLVRREKTVRKPHLKLENPLV